MLDHRNVHRTFGGHMIKNKKNGQNYQAMKNEKGIALFSSLFILALMMIISVSILNSVQKKNEIKNQVNIRLKAANLRYKLLSIINNKANWEVTQKNNSDVLLKNSKQASEEATLDPAAQTKQSSKTSSAQLRPDVSQVVAADPKAVLDVGLVEISPEGVIKTKYPTINLYDAESEKVVIDSNDSKSGFTLDGQPCDTFDAVKGDENCIFKYLVSVINRTYNGAGDPVSYTLHSELLYKPSKTKYPFNPRTNFYSFDQTIDYSNGGSNSNLFQDQAKEICEKYGGEYNFKTNTCTKQVTQANAPCAAGQAYSGPDKDKQCQTTHLANNNCGAGQYMEGFDPTTHLPVCKNYQVLG